MAGNTKNIFVRIALKDAISNRMKAVNGSLKATAKSTQSLNKELGILQGSFLNLRSIITTGAGIGLAMEFKTGLQYVEDFKLSVASMAAFMMTFSKKTAEGDIAGSFKEATKYAERLIPALEIMDAKTVATGRDLKLMVETMMMYGTVIDIDNKKQKQGLINIANALKLLTKGQNQEIQQRQEIHALMMGQMRMTDRLPKILARIHAQSGDISLTLQQQLDIWRQQGTLIENVGHMLEGFGQTVPLIEQAWAAIGTTMQTIHQVILRNGMLSVYTDLLKISKEINLSLRDQDGTMSDLALTIEDKIAGSWEVVKKMADGVLLTIKNFEGPLHLAGSALGGVGKVLKTIVSDSKIFAMVLTTLANVAIRRTLLSVFTRLSIVVSEARVKMLALNAAAMPAGSIFAAMGVKISFASRAMMTLKAAGKGLLAMFGGQAGLVLTIGLGIAELVSWNRISKASEQTADDLAVSIRNARDSFKELGRAQQVVMERDYRDKLAKLEENIPDLEDKVKKYKKSYEELHALAEAAIADEQDDSSQRAEIAKRNFQDTAASLERAKELKQSYLNLLQYMATTRINQTGLAGVPKLITQESEAIKKATANLGKELQTIREKYIYSDIERINAKYDAEKAELTKAFSDKFQLTGKFYQQSTAVLHKYEDGKAKLQEYYDAIEKARLKEIGEYRLKKHKEIADKLLADNKEIYKSLSGMTDGLESFYTVSDKVLSKVEKRYGGLADNLCDFNKIVLNCTDKAYRKMGLMSKHEYEQRKANAKKAYDAIVAADGDTVQAKQAYTNELIQLDNEYHNVTTQNADAFAQTWKDTLSDIGSAWHDMAGIMVEDFWNGDLGTVFERFGDLFEDTLKRMLTRWVQYLADMAATWARRKIWQAIGGNNDGILTGLAGQISGSVGGDNNKNSNITSLIPSSGLGSSIHDWVATNVSEGAADGLATLASGAALVGGGYGVYSGVNNMANGNFAVGAAQTGVGGYSMYQGAVGLDLVPEGTATQFASDVAGYLGYNGGQTTVAPYVSGQVYQQLGSEVGTQVGAQMGDAAAQELSTQLANTTVDYSIDAAGGYAATPEMYSAGWAALPLIGGSIWMGMENATDDKPAEQAYKSWGLNTGSRQDDLASDPALVSSKWTDQFQNVFDFATKGFGNLADMSHQLGAAMDVNHVQQYVSTIAGVNVTMEQSVAIMDLANQAAQGNDLAFNQLYETLNGVMQATGDSTEYASATAYGLVQAMIDAGQATDATVGQLNGITDTMTAQAAAADSLASAMVDSGIATEDTADQISAAYGSGIEAVQAYIDHMNGLDDEWLSSGDVMDEVKAAAEGGTTALQKLIHDLEGTGLSSTQAAQAAQAMTNAVRGFSNTNLDLEATARLNVEVQGAANVSSTISGASSLSSSQYFDPYDPYGDAEGSAVGGIMTRPTFFAPGRYGGEAGAEGILPLPYGPGMMKDIYDATVKSSQQDPKPVVVHNHFYVDGKEIATSIMPAVDRHVTTREARGITGRTTYAPH